MDERDLARLRVELEEFTAEVFSGLPRADQRATAGTYLRGLMLDGKRKSMQPMAARLKVDHQRLQQFVTSSTWDYTGVRRRLAGMVIDLVAPQAWVVDDTGFAKDGTSSPCVARQYSGTLGKVGNCQVAVSVHAATDTASGVLGWRLFMPQSWDDDEALFDADPDARAAVTARRARARIPADEHHRPKWQLALEIIDEAIGWGHRPPVLVGDAGYGEATAFRAGLDERAIPYVLAVKPATSAYPGDAVPAVAARTPARDGSSRGRPPTPAYQNKPANLKTAALAAIKADPGLLQEITWRHGIKTRPDNPTAAMTSRFATLRVRPANRDIPRGQDGSLPEAWLIIEWPPGANEPTDYWLSTLPEDTAPEELVRLAKIRWRIEHDYRELKDGLGLDHFEGRSWTGWHRHTTLASAAQLFITRLRHDQADGRDAPKAPGQA